MTPPLYALEWPSLAECAKLLLADRQSGYPDAVAQGKLTHEQAARGIAAMKAVAAVWRDAAAGTLPDPDFAFDRYGMIETLRSAHARLVAHAAAAAPANRAALSDRRDCVAAMLWWHERFTDGPFHMVRITLAGRALDDAVHERQAA